MNTLTLWFHKLGSPPTFYRFATVMKPWLMALTLITGLLGLWFGVVKGPADYLQGDSVRILYIHVPAAWMSLFIYGVMAVSAAVGIIWRIKIAELSAMCAAPIGATFTAIALITGSLWGRPTWGTYWVWDARLTSELILLFLYFGVIGLYRAIEDPRNAARAAGLLAIVGLVNVPIVHFSVKWWNTLHQADTVKVIGKSSIDPSMLWPLLLMAIATKFYFGWSLLNRLQTALVESEGHKDWAKPLWQSANGHANNAESQS